jgi:selenocysteine-specific elongation factor
MIAGVAGHVDHGKTSLVRALTGVDTDRLPEEKKRGMTIELGFAHLTLPAGLPLSVVDVPGHERLVKTASFGLGGADIVILVIALDEGVMPQTREHLLLCHFMGARAAIIACTKADTPVASDSETLTLFHQEVDTAVSGTIFESAPRLLVSSKTGQGVPELLSALNVLATRLQARNSLGPNALWVDRAFGVKGFGCVVTGTLVSGKLECGDEVQLLPDLPRPHRIRSLQVRGREVQTALAGERVAVNLPQLEARSVPRGVLLTSEGHLRCGSVLDVELQLPPGLREQRQWPQRKRLLMAYGTRQQEVVVQRVGSVADRLFAQVRSEHSLPLMVGQRFVLRGTESTQHRGSVIAGGTVLFVEAARIKKGEDRALTLSKWCDADLPGRVSLLLERAEQKGLTEVSVARTLSVSTTALRAVIEVQLAQGHLQVLERKSRRLIKSSVIDALKTRLLQLLQRFHQRFPSKSGVSGETLKQQLAVNEDRVFELICEPLRLENKIEAEGGLLRLAGQGAVLSAVEQTIKNAILQSFEKAQLAPPTLKELSAALQVPVSRAEALLQLLEADKVLVRAQGLYFARTAVEALKAAVVVHFQSHEELTMADIKHLTGQSRKFCIPLAELLDVEKFTLRVGDVRKRMGHASR